MSMIAGVDEVGRGPLAGPVVAAAVILNPDRPIEGLRDSKKLSPGKRELLSEQIITNAIAYSFGRAEVDEIDELNILQASLLAMQRAILALSRTPELVLVDGNRAPKSPVPVRTIVGGDDSVAEISAASIIAKVSRDREMIILDEQYPDYGFARHKGYPTRAHVDAIKRFGVLPIHRKSFRPVADNL